ncbi:DEKNAAC103205 [Brettanomyces naardenensis]|uniref:DEKNAAC103205 n=1 Tax=Brettanomyces naardenensis TaxID=13370 RepID=A0A448YMU9_BRENA|nr:DEKNAAC103205 [Brettanomyces naardenensis]
MAYGIFHMGGIAGMTGWSWVFLIEGLFTLLIGILSYFLMVPSAVQTKKPWNKKGWFSEREEKIIVNKILRDDPTKGDMHNRQGLNLKMLWEAVCDWYLWPVYIIGIVAYIPVGTLTTYLTLVLKSMGYSTFDVNLLAIPNYVLHIFLLLGITWLSEKRHSIFNVALLQPLWSVPFLGVLAWWKGSFIQKWPSYAVLTLFLAVPYIHAMMVGACSRNSQSIRTRTVSASIYNMFVQAGSIISSNIYRTSDAPLYHTGNAVLFALAFAMFPLLIFTKWFYVTINKRRERKWNSMTYQEREQYILTTKDEGSSCLNFRFAY